MPLYEYEVVETVRHTFLVNKPTPAEALTYANRVADSLAIALPQKRPVLLNAIGVKHAGCHVGTLRVSNEPKIAPVLE